MRLGPKQRFLLVSLVAICGWSNSATAADTVDTTIVRAMGNMGEFDIQLFDPWTPATAANFLGYVERGDYSNSFIHRSVPGFILQGGGFAWRSNQITEVPKRASVTNEAYFSNVRGTVAMAKMGGDPHYQNGGFTVFGVVLGNGMAVADIIAAVPFYDASPFFGAYGPSFSNLPLLNPVLDVATNYVLFTDVRRLAAGTQVFPFDFTASDEGFAAGFADLPADHDPEQFALQSGWTNLPPELGG